MSQRELYEVRNYKTAESHIYANLGQALIACRAFSHRSDAWYLLRVSDGAMWHALVSDGQRWVEVQGFGRRLYTAAGDALRLERAAELLRRRPKRRPPAASRPLVFADMNTATCASS